MARCPFAIWRPISAAYLPGVRKAAHNRMSVHITAALGSPWGFFNSPGRASSEFFTYRTGVIEQYIDSDNRGEGDFDGNDATHAVENEGLGNAPLTPQQVASNARLFRWLRETHGVPNKIATDSKVGVSSHGLAWHRLGIDGNFPALPSIQAGRLQRGGGMHYSTSFGKICPGYDVVPQIPEIFALSQGAVPVSNPSSGGGSTVTAPTGTLPDPLSPEDPNMARLVRNPSNGQIFLVDPAVAVTVVDDESDLNALRTVCGEPIPMLAGDITRIQQQVEKTHADLAADIAAKIKATLTVGTGTGASLEQVEAAVRLALPTPSAPSVGTIDYAALAKAVNDDAARRLAT